MSFVPAARASAHLAGVLALGATLLAGAGVAAGGVAAAGAAAAGVAGAGVAAGGAVASGAGAAGLTQPAPPVSAADFHVEPVGAVPADGDGLIPNAKTPTGSAPGPVAHCSYTANSANGASAASVNRLIRSKENSITSRYVICLAGTFTAPIHVWSKWSEAMLVIEAAPGKTAHLALGE